MGLDHDQEVDDRRFIEAVLRSVRTVRNGVVDHGEPTMERAYALVLIREALSALDKAGDTNAAPHLQMAIDRMLEPRIGPGFGAVSRDIH